MSIGTKENLNNLAVEIDMRIQTILAAFLMTFRRGRGLNLVHFLTSGDLSRGLGDKASALPSWT